MALSRGKSSEHARLQSFQRHHLHTVRLGNVDGEDELAAEGLETGGGAEHVSQLQHAVPRQGPSSIERENDERVVAGRFALLFFREHDEPVASGSGAVGL